MWTVDDWNHPPPSIYHRYMNSGSYMLPPLAITSIRVLDEGGREQALPAGLALA